VDLTQWLVAEHDDTAARLHGQVLELVPAGRRMERPGGGSPILWNTFHITRHAALALDVLSPGAAPPVPDWLPRLAGLAAGAVPVAGLEEAPASWADELPAGGVDVYLNQVLVRAREFLADPGLDFDAVPDVAVGLDRAGVGENDVPWLRRMWTGKPAAWLIRWPLTGHIGNHVGEMLATRNRMGLSPF
jgi:hypothetical protein